MQELFSQLGIDWPLLLSQAVNFFLLLVILRLFVYKPLIKLLRDRRQRIEDGLMKAEEADRRLHDAEATGKERIKAAEAEALAVLARTEDRAKSVEARMLDEAKKKEAEALAGIAPALREKEEESRRALDREAAALVRRAIVKAAELSPSAIDDALIEKAVMEARRNA